MLGYKFLYNKIHPQLIGGSLLQRRWLNVTEYIGMSLLKEFKVTVPNFGLVSSGSEALGVAERVLAASRPSSSLVIKALVPTGGRGKGRFANSDLSGVEVANTPEEAQKLSGLMLGNYLSTKQTVGKGLLCSQVLLAQKLDLTKERYFSLMLDRTSGGIVAIATRQGGGNVEEIAHSNPDNVRTLNVCPLTGLTSKDYESLADFLNFSPELKQTVVTTLENLYSLFLKMDCTLLEINPLSETADKKIVACDSKIIIDDNSKYRQQEIFEKTPVTRTKEEEEAELVGLNYISLDGNVACIVNGAGLAMATLDLIRHHGGSAANFLDVGGNSTSDTLRKALEIVNSDLNAKVLLVNIVGGIVHCDKFALSFIEASKTLNRQLPVVVRLQGTRADVAKKLLNESKIPHLFCTDFDSACRSAVEIASTSSN